MVVEVHFNGLVIGMNKSLIFKSA